MKLLIITQVLNKDFRHSGALGPVDGLNPELSNLTCSITEVKFLLEM